MLRRCLMLAAAAGLACPVLAGQSHPFSQEVLKRTAHLSPLGVIGSPDPDAWLPQFTFVSVEGDATGSIVDVNGPGFAKAWRVRTERKPIEWQTHIQGFFRVPIKAGDTLYLTAYIRTVHTKDGRPEGTARLYASEERGGNMKDSSGLYAGDFAVGREWQRLDFGLKAARDHGPEDELKLMFTFGHTAQTLEIGGLCLVRFPSTVSKEQLPHPALKLDYEGRSPDAPWRKAALERIERVRKAPIRIEVVDSRGRPIRNARVEIVQERSAFRFGGVIPHGMFPGQNVKPWNADFQRTAGAPEADKVRIQKEFLRLFNSATMSTTWTIWYGDDARISRMDIMAALRWYKEHGIDVRNTQAVYPSPEFTPNWAKPWLNKENASEFQQGILAFLRETGERLSPYVSSIQIANELEGRPQYSDALGREAIPEWFQHGKRHGKGMEVMVNGAYELGRSPVSLGTPRREWPQGEGLQWYAEFIQWLRHRKAPLDSIGFQHHTSIGAPSPIAVLKSLDEFASLGIPIEITEFEITLQNGSDPAQRQYQADMFRDFLIACYSHPSVSGVLLQDFWQPGAWQYEGASAFFNADWSLNPHGRAYEDLVLKQWRTKESTASNAQGIAETKGHLGRYRATVVGSFGRSEVLFDLPKGGAKVKVVVKQAAPEPRAKLTRQPH